MQTVYVDTLLCVNMFIDYIMLYSVRRILRISSKGIRLLPAALIGAVLTLGVFLPFYTKLFSVLYRIVGAVITVFTAYGKARIKTFAMRVMTYIGVSLSFSGITALIWLCFKPDGVVIYNDVVYFDLSPVMLIVCTLIAFISLNIYERFKSKYSPKLRIHKVTVVSDKSEYTFDSMVDTGCSLREPFSGLPVIIAEKELIEGEVISDKNLRVVPYKTISGEGSLLAFKPKSVKIDGRTLESGCYVAISEGKLKNETKSLMGSNITEVV